MNRVEVIYREILDYCIKNSNKERADKYLRYFKDGYDAYGLDWKESEAWFNSRCREWALTPAESEELCDLLFRGKQEEIGFAARLLKGMKKHLSKATFEKLKGWFDAYVSNWAQCDMICSEVTPLFLKSGIVLHTDFKEWLFSDSPFTRRAVPVAFIYLVRKVPGTDLSKLIDFIHPIVMDTEKPVRQGVGWFLKEVWKVDRKIAETYLLTIKDTAPRLIIQYATEKMTIPEREKFRKKK